jgi:hypothetical protein
MRYRRGAKNTRALNTCRMAALDVSICHLHLLLQTISVVAHRANTSSLFQHRVVCVLNVTEESMNGYPELQKKLLKPNDFS